ncbi:MAG TPA: hypothetical protein VE200_08185, partial [Xanthobacteraceae bacterium]|nr:hypothetical protein [Xanthobacteraceae bacterium]
MPDIDIGGTTLHYATSGAGEPILLIPGLGLDHSYYRFGMPLLARRLQVLAVDPRGIAVLIAVERADLPDLDRVRCAAGRPRSSQDAPLRIADILGGQA